MEGCAFVKVVFAKFMPKGENLGVSSSFYFDVFNEEGVILLPRYLNLLTKCLFLLLGRIRS